MDTFYIALVALVVINVVAIWVGYRDMKDDHLSDPELPPRASSRLF